MGKGLEKQRRQALLRSAVVHCSGAKATDEEEPGEGWTANSASYCEESSSRGGATASRGWWEGGKRQETRRQCDK